MIVALRLWRKGQPKSSYRYLPEGSRNLTIKILLSGEAVNGGLDHR